MTRFPRVANERGAWGSHSGGPPLFMLEFTSIQEAKARREIVRLGHHRTSTSLDGNQAA